MAVIPPASPQTLQTCGKSVAGIDGCKAGWVMVRRDERGCFGTPLVVQTVGTLPKADMTLIDIPIGLPESGTRDCDLAARDRLGPRSNSVFTGVRRPLLRMGNREEANRWGKQNGGGVSSQLWGILKKVRDVDDWITQEENQTLREGHPELSFLAAAEHPMTHHKSTAAGFAERVAALNDFIAPARVLELMQQTGGYKIAPDDILDALALCRSAARVVLDCYEQVPANSPKDARGLAMEMVF